MANDLCPSCFVSGTNFPDATSFEQHIERCKGERLHALKAHFKSHLREEREKSGLSSRLARRSSAVRGSFNR